MVLEAAGGVSHGPRLGGLFERPPELFEMPLAAIGRLE